MVPAGLIDLPAFKQDATGWAEHGRNDRLSHTRKQAGLTAQLKAYNPE
jgi:hypothetical protein